MAEQQKKLKLWTVYNSPADFPGLYVAREFEMDKPTSNYFAHSLQDNVDQWCIEQASKSGQGQPYPLARHPDDHPTVVHTWL